MTRGLVSHNAFRQVDFEKNIGFASEELPVRKEDAVRYTHIRPQPREQDMNLPTDDVIAPDRIEGAERLLGKLTDAVVHVGILLVVADAAL